MKLDGNRIKREREKRAWSQSHLAELADLGLRTVQRIEGSGSASYESAQALASALSLDVTDLKVPDAARPFVRSQTMKRQMVAALASAAVLGSLFVASGVLADQIMLDLEITVDSNKPTTGHLLIDENKDAEMRIDNVVRFVVVPTITDDQKVMLTNSVYEFSGEDYVLLDQPKLITANHKQAEIRIESESGTSYRFLITPHK